jgi:neutral ceramidase
MSKLRIFPLINLVLLALFAGHGAFAQGNLRVGSARARHHTAFRSSESSSRQDEHEKLHVRAIVIDNGSARGRSDGSGPGRAFRSHLAGRLETNRRRIQLPHREHGHVCRTHPQWLGAWRLSWHARAQAGSQRTAATDRWSDCGCGATSQVKLQPARAGFGTGNSYLNVNRDAVDSETKTMTLRNRSIHKFDDTGVLAISGGGTGFIVNLTSSPVE